MPRRHRPYFDWRIYWLYPLVVMLPVSAAYAVVTYGVSGAGVWLVPLVTVCFTALLWSLAREGLYTDRTGVCVKGLIRSVSLRWDEIERVDDGLERGGSKSVRFHTTDGRVVTTCVQLRAAAIDPYAPMLVQHRYQQLIERLRDMHRSAIGRRPA
ncbi:hypothetical protein Cs7R123_07560 [Catellatospora sp. TT07R-123]|nr:hypothetical protein Cs7R123_07560 [Catellatospora sp. TT07R-123]